MSVRVGRFRKTKKRKITFALKSAAVLEKKGVVVSFLQATTCPIMPVKAALLSLCLWLDLQPNGKMTFPSGSTAKLKS
jgi:hypothetical protein